MNNNTILECQIRNYEHTVNSTQMSKSTKVAFKLFDLLLKQFLFVECYLSKNEPGVNFYNLKLSKKLQFSFL